MRAVEPLVVVWRVTERCDTACGFCAYDVRLSRPRREVEADEVLRFGALLARIDRPVLLSFLGGEPLLWPPLLEVSARLQALGLRLSLTTNGRLLSQERFLTFVTTLTELTVSLDGPPELHDRLRGRPGLGASVLATLRRLSALPVRPRLRVNTVLTDETAPRFAETCALVAGAGADVLTFNALGGNDRPAYFAAHRLRDLGPVVDALPAARAAGLQVSGEADYLARLAAGIDGRALPVADCRPGASFWFVETNGQLAACSFTVGEHGLPVASLREPADLARVGERLRAARALRRARACDDCPSTQVHGKFA
jgi:MoaA/NifB/PqqE/SkfB family radical SAM enzyme